MAYSKSMKHIVLMFAALTLVGAQTPVECSGNAFLHAYNKDEPKMETCRGVDRFSLPCRGKGEWDGPGILKCGTCGQRWKKAN